MVEIDKENSKWQEMAARRRQYIRTFFVSAEMAFRRFKRHPHALYEEYEELINLTIKLVQKIYFQSLVSRIEEEIEKIHTVLLLSKAQKMHREMYTWEVWMS